MKLMYGNVPVKSMNIHTYEMDTNSATVQPSDLQAGITCFARGQKITGTGKVFSFASYGDMETNMPWFVPSDINIIEIGCVDYPVQHIISLKNMPNIDFSSEQLVANIIIDNVAYPIKVSVVSNILTIACDRNITVQTFFGKDEYI